MSKGAFNLLPGVVGNEGDGENEKDGEDEGNKAEEKDEEPVKPDGGDEHDKQDESNEDDEDDGIGGEMDAEFLDREHLKTIMAKQDPDLLRAVGHQFEDFVVYCTYRGVSCA